MISVYCSYQITDKGNGTLNAEHQAVVPITTSEFAPVEKNEITFNNKYEG